MDLEDITMLTKSQILSKDTLQEIFEEEGVNRVELLINLSARAKELKIKSEFEGKIKTANDSLKVERDKSIEHSKIVAELESRAKTAETRYLKGKIANEKGIPYALADRLIGDTEEELLKDAESVSALLAPRSAPPLFTNDTNHGLPGTPNATDAAFAQLLSELSQQN